MGDRDERRMQARVYYGEYTLRHWLNLMLSKNICLPAYQRSFVWEEDDVKRLLESLMTGQFITPVTIAHYQGTEGSKDLILDGQQRLTSLLLAYLGFMPIKEMFKSTEDNLAHGDDSREEAEGEVMEWTYKLLLEDKPQKNTLPLIKDHLRGDPRYKKIGLSASTDNGAKGKRAGFLTYVKWIFALICAIIVLIITVKVCLRRSLL